MTENERLTFETELGISIDKNEDCPTMSICWNCDIPPRRCNYFKDAIDKLAKYEAIGTIEEFKALKEKNDPKKPLFVPTDDTCLYHEYRCPSCNEWLADKFKPYRCKCGQKLDWQ